MVFVFTCNTTGFNSLDFILLLISVVLLAHVHDTVAIVLRLVGAFALQSLGLRLDQFL